MQQLMRVQLRWDEEGLKKGPVEQKAKFITPIRWHGVDENTIGPIVVGIIDDSMRITEEECSFFLVRVNHKFEKTVVGRSFPGQTRNGVYVFSPCVA